MEMIVGGEPINADPPMRAMELMYDPTITDWAQVITINSRDFGPLLHEGSSALVGGDSRSLFCQNFVENSLRWKVCPRDLRDLFQAIDSAEDEEAGKGGSTNEEGLGEDGRRSGRTSWPGLLVVISSSSHYLLFTRLPTFLIASLLTLTEEDLLAKVMETNAALESMYKKILLCLDNPRSKLSMFFLENYDEDVERSEELQEKFYLKYTDKIAEILEETYEEEVRIGRSDKHDES
jgi:hypothetical protein